MAQSADHKPPPDLIADDIAAKLERCLPTLDDSASSSEKLERCAFDVLVLVNTLTPKPRGMGFLLRWLTWHNPAAAQDLREAVHFVESQAGRFMAAQDDDPTETDNLLLDTAVEALITELHDIAVLIRSEAAAGVNQGEDGSAEAAWKNVPDDIFLSPAELAGMLDVPKEALRKRLERERMIDHDCFREVADRGAKEAQFLYRVRTARPLSEALKKKMSSETSSKRPA